MKIGRQKLTVTNCRSEFRAPVIRRMQMKMVKNMKTSLK